VSQSPAKAVTGEDAPYWAGLAEGRLLLPRCGGCARWIWPAAHRCGQCGASDMRWEALPMRATVFAWTRTWHRFGLTEGLDLPFTSIVAEVAGCGIRLYGRLHDPDCVNPRIGQPLTGEVGETRVGAESIPTIIWSRSA
jgi:uncharacterized OB-fold protein